MTWDDVLDRLTSAGLHPNEEIYVDNYGNMLPLDHPEFRGRFLRCARGVIHSGDLRFEVFLFPSESQLRDFLDVLGHDPWWLIHENVILHFPESDPAVIGNILEAIKGPIR